SSTVRLMLLPARVQLGSPARAVAISCSLSRSTRPPYSCRPVTAAARQRIPVVWPRQAVRGQGSAATSLGSSPLMMTRDEAQPADGQPRPTPLHAVHERLGATMTDFAGWLMPLRYGSETAEHRAVRGAAGLFDLSHMGEIAVSGPGAAAALDYALVGHLSSLQPGRARYTMICAPDGGVLDDLIVYRLADTEFLVVANAANTPVVAAALQERATGYLADVNDLTDDYALIAIQGPHAGRILQPLADIGLYEVRYYAGQWAVVAGRKVLLARTGYTGEDGFELF